MEEETRIDKKPRTKWWNLEYENLKFFKTENKWEVTENANDMWNNMARHIKRVSTVILGESTGNRKSDKGSW